MRYQSFYPFAQNQGNDFFGMSNSNPQNTPNNAFDFWGGNQTAPPPPPAPTPAGPATNFFSQFQSAPTGGFQQGQPGQPVSRTMGYLQTADKFLNTAQQLTPMVRQFAPMIQNVPALLKLYRGFQSVPAATTAVAAANVGASGASTAARAASTASAVTNGASIPRIFQPPI